MAVAIFDHLNKKDTTDADGWWWGVDIRGSNRFKDRSAIAAYGLPMPDIATFYDLWLTLTKAAG